MDEQESSHHIIQSLEAKEQKNRPLAIRFADLLTSSFGSFAFFSGNALFFAIWILVNIGAVPGLPVFDPYPFTFLTMVVSLEAIFLSIIVLMSQNRQSFISTLREELDMQVNLWSEQEITKVLELQKRLLEHFNIEVHDRELNDMLKATDISYIERQLEEQLRPKQKKTLKVIRDIEKEVGKEIEKAAKDVGV